MPKISVQANLLLVTTSISGLILCKMTEDPIKTIKSRISYFARDSVLKSKSDILDVSQPDRVYRKSKDLHETMKRKPNSCSSCYSTYDFRYWIYNKLGQDPLICIFYWYMSMGTCNVLGGAQTQTS
ncbi:uncharacterized protein EV154DRAFT_487336 [Mucor mucedo]|uniref:uncharacterized protein n=1 Tax=Mucor mucedo TaxID=29922 RepID=UPI00222111ED|nr:uncharacterized protein EV154DRAFT_487336 [Mucor mucedo]KAI7873238.1 hypothetical protein EV154DRAFT_487336 [Mucor mucedo]